MNGAIRLLLLLSALIPLLAQRAQAESLRAGAFKVDITPSNSEQLWGYFDRKGPADGTLDPLMAKVLVLDDGKTRIAFVTLDLGRTFGSPSMEAVRSRVKKSAQVNQVFFSASHTHSGPVIEDEYENNKPPEWERVALDRIGEAIESATGLLGPASIGTGYGETFIGHNRRYLQPDGTVKMLWRNSGKMPTHPIDPRVGVIRIDSAGGGTIAILVNYSCHPVVLGPDNLKYSADYPSAMARIVESNFEGDPVCLFLQGGAGDINPYFDKMELAEDAIRLMNETGEQLGDEVVRVGSAIDPNLVDNASLKYSIDTLKFEPRWDMDQVLAGMKSQLTPYVFERYKKYLTSPLDCPVMTLLINDQIALMGMPGEPFVEFATDFRQRAPAKDAFFVGYANGYKAYFPTIKAAVEGGYGANHVGARAEVGAGEKMVDQAVIRLFELQGKLTRIPGF